MKQRPLRTGGIVQPDPFATDIDAGLVRVNNGLSRQTLFRQHFEDRQAIISVAIKVGQGAGANRQVEVFGKVRLHAVIRNQLEHRHINCIGLDRSAILSRTCHARREWGDESLAVPILQDLRAKLGDVTLDAQIDDLAAFKADLLIIARRQGRLSMLMVRMSSGSSTGFSVLPL